MSHRHLEHDLQTTVAAYLSKALAPEVWWTSVDAGQGAMGRIAAMRRKARGVKAGTPDVLLLWNGQFRSIELKVGRGQPTEVQQLVAGQIVGAGGGYVCCNSVEEVERALRGWGFPVRATTMTAQERDQRRAEKQARRATQKPTQLNPAAGRWNTRPTSRSALRALERARRQGVMV